MNLTTYSKENQPTKTASAISKKYSSPENIFSYVLFRFVQVINNFSILGNFQSEPQRALAIYHHFPRKVLIEKCQQFKRKYFSFSFAPKSPHQWQGEDGKREDAKISLVFFNPFQCIKLDLSWANCKFIQSPHVVSSHNFSGYNYNVPTTSGPQVLSLEELT